MQVMSFNLVVALGFLYSEEEVCYDAWGMMFMFYKCHVITWAKMIYVLSTLSFLIVCFCSPAYEVWPVNCLTCQFKFGNSTLVYLLMILLNCQSLVIQLS